MQTIRGMYGHLDWANRRLLGALRNVPADKAGDVLRLFLHVLRAERIWLTRLRGENSEGIVLWPERAEADECAEMIEQNGEGYRALLDGLDDEEILKTLAYRSLKGTPAENKVRDILLQVALHGQYHRGQINAAMRAGGYEPAAMDYILFARERG